MVTERGYKKRRNSQYKGIGQDINNAIIMHEIVSKWTNADTAIDVDHWVIALFLLTRLLCSLPFTLTLSAPIV